MTLIGVPRNTIVDIITADVDSIYRPQIDEIRQSLKSPASWQSTPDKKLPPEVFSSLKKLVEQRAYVLKELLGISVDFQDEMDRVTEKVQDRLAFIAPERRQAFAATEKHYKTHLGDMTGNIRDDEMARIESLAKIQAALSTEEYRIWERASTPAALTVRAVFGRLDLSDEQFERLFELQKKHHSELSQALLDVVDAADLEGLPDPDLTTSEIASVLTETQLKEYSEHPGSTTIMP